MNSTIYGHVDREFADPEFFKAVAEVVAHYDRYHEQRNEIKEQQVREGRVRELAARAGYRIMHRRNGQFWLMYGKPVMLDWIEQWLGERGYR